MLVAVLGQRRFSYYYAINAALLTGYFCWRILDFAGLRELLAKPKETVKAFKKAKKEKANATEKAFLQPRATWIKVIVAGIAIFFLAFFPNIDKANAIASRPPLITQGWYSSLVWLKDNSPEPFEDADFYYERYETPFHYPETAYSVMSWWDYGHWITRIAHRIPVSNPFQQGAPEAGRFFIAQEEDSANQASELGVRYVVIDHLMPTAKFYAMPEWAGESNSVFREYYGVPLEGGGGTPQWLGLLHYPSYYNSTVARLYNFDGEAVAPSENSTVVVPWDGESNWEAAKIGYKNITAEPKFFSSYEEAEDYVSNQESGNYVIGSFDPFMTPVPLEKMEHYELVYASEQKWQGKPTVKIFEYSE